MNARREFEIDVDMALNKALYAAAHAYAFAFYVADDFTEVLKGAGARRWEFSKILMLQVGGWVAGCFPHACPSAWRRVFFGQPV
jgi:hypothetical protein